MKPSLVSTAVIATVLSSVAATHDGCGSTSDSPTLAPTTGPTLAPPTPGNWVSLGGFAHDISFDGHHACAKTGDGAFCGLTSQPFGQWAKVPTTVTAIEQVATANGVAFIWGSTEGKHMLQTVDLATGATHDTAMNEAPRQFATDGKVVLGTTDAHFVGGDVTASGVNKLVSIADNDSLEVYKTAVAGNDVYVTDYEGVIKYSTLDRAAWTVRPFGYADTDFRARELASDGVDLCVITYTLEITCAKLATGLETWETYPGKWWALAVANNTLTAVTFVDRDVQVTQLK